MDQIFQGQVAVISGGLGDIGKATADSFAAESSQLANIGANQQILLTRDFDNAVVEITLTRDNPLVLFDSPRTQQVNIAMSARRKEGGAIPAGNEALLQLNRTYAVVLAENEKPAFFLLREWMVVVGNSGSGVKVTTTQGEAR